jgi:hypothetical protein
MARQQGEMPRARSTLGCLWAAALCACGSGTPGAAGSANRQSIVLGTGEAEFEPMAGEPEITLVHGSQGGFHVWASFLAYGFEQPTLNLLITTSVDGSADEPLVMHASLTTHEVVDADGVTARTFAGFPAQIRNAPCVDGRRVKIDLQLSEGSGPASEDVRYCIAEVDPMYRSDACP